MLIEDKNINEIRCRTSTSLEEENFRAFCKQMLKAKVFKGNYQERRLVRSIGGFRDLIVVDKNEHDLIQCLEYLQKRINNFYDSKKDVWIGITLPTMIGAPAAGVCIWTEVSEIPLGKHWFYIKTIKFRDNEIFIKIQSLRYVENDDSNDSGIFSKLSLSKNAHSDNENVNVPTINDFIKLLKTWKNNISLALITFLSNDVNRENIIMVLRFIGMMAISFITLSIETLKYIGVYGFRLLIELRLWVYTLTPIILKVFDIILKAIGGLYILIAMIWRDIFGNRNGSAQLYQSLRATNESNTRRPLPITYGREYYQGLHNSKKSYSYRNN